MIDEALGKLGIRPGDLRGAFLERRARRADRAGPSRARRRPGDAGAGGLSLAGRRRAIQRAHCDAGGGPLLAYTITLPLGYFLAGPGARGAFLPQTMPDGFVKDSATPLLLRPRAFIANARDLVTLKAAVTEQAPRYAEIRTPITIITGDADKTVSTNIHSRPLAASRRTPD